MFALRVVSMDEILRFKNTLIIVVVVVFILKKIQVAFVKTGNEFILLLTSTHLLHTVLIKIIITVQISPRF